MKTLVKTLGFLGVIALTMMGSAFGGTNLETLIDKESTGFQAAFIEAENNDRLVVCLHNPSDNELSFSIKNDDGEAIHKEFISGNDTFLKRFDFSEVVDGNYFLEVEGNNQQYVESILVR